jgi:hypothetical protein
MHKKLSKRLNLIIYITRVLFFKDYRESLKDIVTRRILIVSDKFAYRLELWCGSIMVRSHYNNYKI